MELGLESRHSDVKVCIIEQYALLVGLREGYR